MCLEVISRLNGFGKVASWLYSGADAKGRHLVRLDYGNRKQELSYSK